MHPYNSYVIYLTAAVKINTIKTQWALHAKKKVVVLMDPHLI